MHLALNRLLLISFCIHSLVFRLDASEQQDRENRKLKRTSGRSRQNSLVQRSATDNSEFVFVQNSNDNVQKELKKTKSVDYETMVKPGFFSYKKRIEVWKNTYHETSKNNLFHSAPELSEHGIINTVIKANEPLEYDTVSEKSPEQSNVTSDDESIISQELNLEGTSALHEHIKNIRELELLLTSEFANIDALLANNDVSGLLTTKDSSGFTPIDLIRAMKPEHPSFLNTWLALFMDLLKSPVQGHTVDLHPVFRAYMMMTSNREDYRNNQITPASYYTEKYKEQ